MSTVSRGTVNGRMMIWNTSTLQWEVWDGTLGVDSVTIGTVIDGGSGKTLKTAVISRSTTGTVIAAVTSKIIKVYGIRFICDAALDVNLRSGASTALEGVQSFAANAGVAENVGPPNFLYKTAVGESLDLVISGSGNVRGIIRYWDDDAA